MNKFNQKEWDKLNRVRISCRFFIAKDYGDNDGGTGYLTCAKTTDTAKWCPAECKNYEGRNR